MFMLLGRGYIVIKVAMQVVIPKWRLPRLSWAPTVEIISYLPITEVTTRQM